MFCRCMLACEFALRAGWSRLQKSAVFVVCAEKALLLEAQTGCSNQA